MVYGTSNGPQNDIGNYLGPCSTDIGIPSCLSKLPALSFEETIGATIGIMEKKMETTIMGLGFRV